MSESPIKIALFIHIYYLDLWQEYKEILGQFPFEFNLYVNIVDQEGYIPVLNDIKHKYPDSTIIVSTNKGLDSGGQLRLYDILLKNNSGEKYIVFLHTKKSLHNKNKKFGYDWRRKLQEVVRPDNAMVSYRILEGSSNVGMIGSKRYHTVHPNDVWWYDKNKESFEAYLSELNLPVSNEYEFIAGTMFWIRTEVLSLFFADKNIMEIINGFEDGYSDDGYKAHFFERIYGIIVKHYGYKLISI